MSATAKFTKHYFQGLLICRRTQLERRTLEGPSPPLVLGAPPPPPCSEACGHHHARRSSAASPARSFTWHPCSGHRPAQHHRVLVPPFCSEIRPLEYLGCLCAPLGAPTPSHNPPPVPPLAPSPPAREPVEAGCGGRWADK